MESTKGTNETRKTYLLALLVIKYRYYHDNSLITEPVDRLYKRDCEPKGTNEIHRTANKLLNAVFYYVPHLVLKKKQYIEEKYKKIMMSEKRNIVKMSKGTNGIHEKYERNSKNVPLKKCGKRLNIEQYNEYTFYIHNASNFDID